MSHHSILSAPEIFTSAPLPVVCFVYIIPVARPAAAHRSNRPYRRCCMRQRYTRQVRILFRRVLPIPTRSIDRGQLVLVIKLEERADNDNAILPGPNPALPARAQVGPAETKG